MDKRIIGFDLETTGLSFNDELLQVSFVDDKQKVLLSEYIKPVKHTEWPEAMEHNQITPDMVKNARTLEEAKEDIIKILDSADILVGFNSNTFDVKRLEMWLDYKIKASCVDVKSMAEKEFGMYPKIVVSLDDVCNWFGVVNEKAHDSLADTKATIQIFNRMIAESQKPKLATIYKFDDGKLIYTERLANKYKEKTGSNITETIYLENGRKIDEPQDFSKYRIGNFIKGEKQFNLNKEIDLCIDQCTVVLANYGMSVEDARDELDRTLDNYIDNLLARGADKSFIEEFQKAVIDYCINQNNKEQTLLCKGISWDVDQDDMSDEEYNELLKTLPTETSISIEIEKDATKEEINDKCVDELSNKFGYCINGIKEITYDS